jgi:autotransporter-associated beta strand protein
LPAGVTNVSIDRINEMYNSNWAVDIVPGVVTLSTAPAAPSGLAAKAASPSQINLSWTNNASNQTGFQVWRALNSSFTQNLTLVATTAANVTNYSDTGLSWSTTYYYYVCATNIGGDSPDSNAANAATLPSLPTVLLVTDAGGTYNTNSFPASATVDGGGSLEGVSPTFTYYVGIGTGGASLGSTAPSGAGTYTVVASFAGSADYAAAQSPPLTFTIGTATPTVVATDAGGTYNSNSFPASAYIAGVGNQSAVAGSLEGVSPAFTYYVGAGTGGASLGSTAPSGAGTYTVVASFAGSADYAAAQSPPLTFAIDATTLTVSATDWTAAGLTLTLGGDNNLHVYITGTTTDAVAPCPPASVANVAIAAPSGTAANLTINSTAGNPIPAGDLTYCGAGGLIKIGSGTVTLSGADTYTGGTTVSAGTLVVTCSSALAANTSLTVGAGAIFVFDPSLDATPSAVVAAATPVAALPLASPLQALQAAPQTNATSKSVPAGVSGTRAAHRLVWSTTTRSVAWDPAWLGQAANSSDNADEQRKKDLAILALEAVFFQYGQ